MAREEVEPKHGTEPLCAHEGQQVCIKYLNMKNVNKVKKRLLVWYLMTENWTIKYVINVCEIKQVTHETVNCQHSVWGERVLFKIELM